MKNIAVFVLIFWQTILSFQAEINKNEQYVNNIKRIVKQDGYTLDSHEVTTEDGYILGLQRIQNKGPAILIMHGLLGSSQDFLIFGNDKSLAYALADQGYDVWLGNNRGNTLSRKHNNTDANMENFWNFSFHEMGYYDCPALIDYILSKTSQSSITLIGHAQGATQFLVLISTKPEYMSKVNQIIAFAPFTYMSHIPHPLLQLLKDQFSLMEAVLSQYKIYEFLPHMDKYVRLLKTACNSGILLSKICSLVPYVLGGMNPQALELNTLFTFVGAFPAGTSVKNINHLFQQIKSGHFQQFDYGIIGNMNKYNTIAPPVYNLTNIRIPVNIFYSKNDWLASEYDMERLAQELPICEKKVIESKYFNHYDFFMAKNLKSLLHFDVINIVNKHHNIPEISSTSTTTVRNTPFTKSQSSRHPTSIISDKTTLSPPTTSEQSTQKPNSSYSLDYSLLLYIMGVIVLAVK